LTRTTPDLLKSSVSGAGCLVEFRADKKPMDNIDVRRALIMAIDRKTILKDYLHDQGQLDWWPLDASSVKTYTPLDQQPKELQELFEYNPDKARQLLKMPAMAAASPWTCCTATGRRSKITSC